MLLLRSVATSPRARVEVAQAARFESRAIELPLESYRTRAEKFEQRIADLTAGAVKPATCWNREPPALTQLVNEPLQKYARREGDRLRAELRAHRASRRSVGRELSAGLEEWVVRDHRAGVRRARPRFEAAIADQLTELSALRAAHPANP